MAPIPSTEAASLLPALTQQLHAFFHHLDQRRYDALLDLFTDDCRWLRQGQWQNGKAAVRAALEARPASLDTRHVMSNAYLAAQDGGRVTLEAYMTAYRYPVVQGADATPPRIAHPLRFNLTTTVFRRDAGHDWRIEEQRVVVAFSFPE